MTEINLCRKTKKWHFFVNIYHSKRFFITLIWINWAVKLYSWPLAFHRVVQQQIWREVVLFILLSLQILSGFNSKKLRNLVQFCRSYHKNKSGPLFQTRGSWLLICCMQFRFLHDCKIKHWSSWDRKSVV